MTQINQWIDRFAFTSISLMLAALPMAAIGFVVRSL